jgi:hypothetical protein
VYPDAWNQSSCRAGLAHEIKHDGYRLIVQRDGGRVRLFTRNGYDWSDRYPLIVEAALRNRSTSFVIDGEAVLLGVDGISDFNGLHSRRHNDEVQLYAFDILALEREARPAEGYSDVIWLGLVVYFYFLGTRFFGLGPDRPDGSASSPWHGQASLNASKARVMPGTFQSIRILVEISQQNPWHFPKCYLAPEGMLARQVAGLVKKTWQSRSFPRMRRRTVPRRNRGTSLQQVARNISAHPLLYRQLCRWPL